MRARRGARSSDEIGGSEFASETDAPRSAQTPSDLLEIVFTSGTTGFPKGVPLTHKNIVSNIEQIKRAVTITSDFRFLSLLPLSHLFEQVPGFLVPFLSGASVTYLRTLKPSEIIRALHETRITHAVIVPRLLRLLMDGALRELRAKRLGWLAKTPGLRAFVRRRLVGPAFEYFSSGGAPLEPDIETFFWRLKIPVYQGYGLTETSPVLTSNRPGANVRQTVGQALPGVEIKIAIDGEILARGDNVFAGYYQNPEETAKAFTDDGWFRTGDIGSLFAQGYLTIHDRKKDLIVTAEGLNVYPIDIEEILIREPGVRDAAIIGKKTEAGEEVHAALLLDPAAGRKPDDVIAAINEKLADYQKIRSWSVWPQEDFPRTTTLKVKKFEVRKWLETAGEAAPPVPTRASRIEQMIRRLTRKPIEPVSRLGIDLGLSSIDRLELASTIEREMNIEVDEERLRAETTVSELEEMVAARRRARLLRFPRWTFSLPATLLRRFLQEAALFPVARIWTRRPEIKGLERLRDLSGPVIFAANHVSHSDTPVLWMTLPKRQRARIAVAALTEYFFPGGSLLHRALRRVQYSLATTLFAAYLMPREHGARASLQFTGELIDRGWSVIIYPEGFRSETGKLLPFKTGIGLLAAELRVPIVPVKISGTFEVMRVGARWPKRHATSIAFGAPLLWRGESMVEMTKKIQNAVARLRVHKVDSLS